jgi:hypothetical protein
MVSREGSSDLKRSRRSCWVRQSWRMSSCSRGDPPSVPPAVWVGGRSTYSERQCLGAEHTGQSMLDVGPRHPTCTRNSQCPHASSLPLVSTHVRSRVGPYVSVPTRQPSLVSPIAPDQRVSPPCVSSNASTVWCKSASWNVCDVPRASPILCSVQHQAPRPTLSTVLLCRKRERGAPGEGRELHSPPGGLASRD